MTATRTDFRPIDRSQHELLIVDDNPASLYATSRLLRGAGFRTREASNGREALERVDDTVSALVLDVHLPDIDGFELCALVRSRGGLTRIPVLHLTAAYVTDEDKVRGLDSGADAYLTRPVEPAVLVATVQALVRTRIAEEAMRRSESKFRAIYAQAPGGICLLDDQGRIVDANAAMLALLGRPLGEVAGQPLADFAALAWRDALQHFAARAADAPPNQEISVLRPDGTIVHVAWNMSPGVEPGLAMAMAADVSQRVALEEQRRQLLERERVARSEAEQVSRMKDDLIAVLSHELRTPLNAIVSWAHVLMRRGGTEEQMRGYAAIERNGQAQARMIADLLDMSRLNVGKLPLAFQFLDPGEAVASAVNAMRPASDGGDPAGPVIELVLAPPYRPLRADPARLQQIVWNLLSNAIKFSPPQGTVRVELAEDEVGVALTVADQGQGIAPEFLPFVFDRFAQSASATSRQRGGLGLGLAIVKQLVEAHGGTIDASSEGLGRGARFVVHLPSDGGSAAAEPAPSKAENDAPGPAAATEEPGAAEPSLAGLKLLVVDDDAEASAMLQIILSERGARVRTATDVPGALQLFEADPPDALISDIGMPGQDGYDLIREVRRRELGTGRHAVAVALTSFTRPQDRTQAMAAGFDAHCAKPLRPLVLVQQLRQLHALQSAASRAHKS